MKRVLVVVGIAIFAATVFFGWVYYASYPAYVKSQNYFNQIPPYPYASAVKFPALFAPLSSADYQVTYRTKDRWEDVFTWYYQHLSPSWHASGRSNNTTTQSVSFTNDNDSYRLSFSYQTTADSGGNFTYTVTVATK